MSELLASLLAWGVMMLAFGCLGFALAVGAALGIEVVVGL
jgi:hypothetical protein